MAPGKLEPKAVVDDLEEKKPKRGASCGEADTQTVRNAASRGAKPRSRGLASVAAGDLIGDAKANPMGQHRRAVERTTARGQRFLMRELGCAGREGP